MAHILLKEYKKCMKQLLLPWKLLIVDSSYRDTNCKNRVSIQFNGFFSQVRARHETLNQCFKQFGILGLRFRECLQNFGIHFKAVAYLVLLMIWNGHPFFSINKRAHFSTIPDYYRKFQGDLELFLTLLKRYRCRSLWR